MKNAMHKLAMPLAAAICTAAVSQTFATDLESYRFRYDFSSGANVFHGSGAVSADFVTSGEPAYTSVYDPDGAETAVHPTTAGYGTIGADTLNATWTLAMHVRPGSVEGGVLLGLGRLNKDNLKSVVFSASSEANKFKVYVEKRVPSNKRSHEATIELADIVTTGFHSIFAVHHAPPSGNNGMLQIYWDGVLKATYTTTSDFPFGDLMQFCSSPSYLVSPCVNSSENPDVAFHDLRFFSHAFTAADAAAYAAKYPAGTLRQSAYVQSASTNAVDTGYLTNPRTRYTADFQYLTNTKQSRIFGAYGDAGCNLYVNSSTVFGYAMQDGGAGWSNFGVGVDYRRRVATEDAFANSATLRLVQEPGGIVTKTLGGTHANTATITTTLYAERQEVDGKYLNLSSSRIYSFAIDETEEVDGVNVLTPVHFFVPTINDVGKAGFTNIVAGTFHGEANGEGVSPALAYCGGVGSVEDYKYEDGVLSAKIYVADLCRWAKRRRRAPRRSGWSTRGRSRSRPCRRAARSSSAGSATLARSRTAARRQTSRSRSRARPPRSSRRVSAQARGRSGTTAPCRASRRERRTSTWATTCRAGSSSTSTASATRARPRRTIPRRRRG